MMLLICAQFRSAATRQWMRVRGVVNLHHAGNACELRGLRRHRCPIRRAYRDRDLRLRQSARAGDALGGGGI
jgi:hypothetical protein